MTDPHVSDLFAEGTAPHHDPVFAHSVAAEVGRARLRMRLGAIALPASVVLVLSGAAFVAAGLARPVLEGLVEQAPQFMGAPVPLVLAAGLALGTLNHVLSRRRAPELEARLAEPA